MLFSLGLNTYVINVIEFQECCHGSAQKNQKEMIGKTEWFVRIVTYPTRGYMARLMESFHFQVRIKQYLKVFSSWWECIRAPFPQHNLEVLEGKNHGTSSVSHISARLMGNNDFSTLQMSMTSNFITSFHKVETETTETVTVASLRPGKIISVKTTANSSPSPQRPGKKKAEEVKVAQCQNRLIKTSVEHFSSRDA